MSTLFLMQGPPGSGKSTIAKHIETSLKKEGQRVIICSTDDLFYDNGIYNFRPELLSHYHAKNLEMAKLAMDANWHVIIDNTNIRKVHVLPYIQYAESLDFDIQVIRCYGKFENIHGVPPDTVSKIRRLMEDLL